MASYMGFDIIPDLFTNPWQVVLAKKIFKDTGDKRLKDIGGAQGWNDDLIDKLVKLASEPLLPGANRWVYMKANANVSDAICKSFFNHIKDPDVIDTPSFIGDLGESIRNFLKGASKIPEAAMDNLTLILIVAGLAAAGYLVFSTKKFLPAKKEIPSTTA